MQQYFLFFHLFIKNAFASFSLCFSIVFIYIFYYFNYLFSFRSVVVSISRRHWKIAEELIICTLWIESFQQFLLWQWQHTRQIGWQRAAQRTAKGQRLQSVTANDVRTEREKEKRVPEAKRVSISERGRERLHASERGASFISGASYDANGRAKQSSKHDTHIHTHSHTPRGVKRQSSTDQSECCESKIYIEQLPTLTQSHIYRHMLIVLKRGENEMQRNEWVAQNVRNKMETGTWK